MNRIFIDMDGVIVDFDAYRLDNEMTVDEVKYTPGAYRNMKPIPGAVEAVKRLIELGFDVWIATKPPTGGTHAYSEKAEWIIEHLPELKRNIIITHDKGLLGDDQDFLCDDRPHKANCEQFKGTLIRFVDGYHWSQALKYFEVVSEKEQLVVDILTIIMNRISQDGWNCEKSMYDEYWVTPPEDDERMNWCANWKRISDESTGKVYVYPHWIV